MERGRGVCVCVCVRVGGGEASWRSWLTVVLQRLVFVLGDQVLALQSKTRQRHVVFEISAGYRILAHQGKTMQAIEEDASPGHPKSTCKPCVFCVS